VAGTVIEEPIVRILFKGEIAAEIPATALADNTPIYHRELLAQAPEYARKAWEWTEDLLPPCTVSGIHINNTFKTWNDILLTLLDTPSIASKRWVYRQYDHQVQNNTVILPGGGDAAIVRLRPVNYFENEIKVDYKRGVAATVDCNSRYVYLNPYEGAKAVVAEAARNLSCVGAEPIAVTDNLNFGSPEHPVGYWQLAEACRGIAEACKEFSTPVTGGNVSLYNETLDAEGKPQAIYPTPVIGMVGLVNDISQTCGLAWQSEGDIIYLLGLGQFQAEETEIKDSRMGLGASEYLAQIHSIIAGKPPEVDYDLERKVQGVCREGIRQSWVNSAHDSAEGGLAVALAECCINSEKGATIDLGIDSLLQRRWDKILFAEGGARILVSVSPQNQANWESYLQQQLGETGELWHNLGKVEGSSAPLKILAGNELMLVEMGVVEMKDCYFNAIERRMHS
jgi:phosphoribosylformylglycinamidine synthase